MRAIVEPADGVPVNGVVPGKLAPARFESLKNLFADSGRAYGVEQNLDLHSLARFGGEGPGEHRPYRAGPVDVSFDGDRLFGLAYGLDHRGVKLVAVVEYIHAVSFGEWNAGRSGNACQELIGSGREFVIEAIAGRVLARRDEVGQQRHDGE